MTILLPLYTGSLDSLTQTGAVEAPSLHGKERILVVDDESVLCEMAAEMLGQYGYSVELAYGGEDALEKLAAKEFDLVLSDVIMPGMSGYQLAHEVYKLYPGVKIQLNSGFNDDCDRDEGDEYLFKNTLNKPYTTVELITRIRKTLDS